MGPREMLAVMEEIRASVSGPLAALPVPYRTREGSFMLLTRPNGEPAFPTYLDSYLLDRSEMADFALASQALGVGYIGTCCGAGPHHVRAMAEALGRRPKAGKYSPLGRASDLTGA
jgi:betaine-homocysteine S-methyltransferase